jgi:multidrug resistance efflux pump
VKVPLSIETAEAALVRARADVVVAEAEASEAERDRSRAHELRVRGTLSPHELDESELALARARGA